MSRYVWNLEHGDVSLSSPEGLGSTKPPGKTWQPHPLRHTSSLLISENLDQAVPLDTRVLGVSGAVALAGVGVLLHFMGEIGGEFMGGMGLPIVGTSLALIAAHATFGSLLVMAVSTRRPVGGALMGALALLCILALPIVDATTRSMVRGEAPHVACGHRISDLWSLTQRYEEETGLALHYGSYEFLRPVWERYRAEHASAFFCPQASNFQGASERAGGLAAAKFSEISYTGGLFRPSARLAAAGGIGPPLLWERESSHGVRGLQVYTAEIGARTCSTVAFYGRKALFDQREASQSSTLTSSEKEPFAHR